jgi:hypothetical protein
MERAQLRDKPLVVFRTICCFFVSCFFNSNVIFFKDIAERFFTLVLDSSLADLSEEIGNPLANFFIG